jgi:hypothetical protein
MPIASRARIGPRGPPGAVPGRQRRRSAPRVASRSRIPTGTGVHRAGVGASAAPCGSLRPRVAPGKQRQAPSTSSDRVPDRGMNDRRAPGDVPRWDGVTAPREGMPRILKLPRFRGHPDIFERSPHAKRQTDRCRMLPRCRWTEGVGHSCSMAANRGSCSAPTSCAGRRPATPLASPEPIASWKRSRRRHCSRCCAPAGSRSCHSCTHRRRRRLERGNHPS